MSKAFPIVLIAFLAAAPSISAQIVNPADKQKSPKENAAQEEESRHSWELPAISVPGAPLPEFRDDELVGSYGQPRWTTQRLFTNTRVYVIPEGQVEFEYWMVPEKARHGEWEIQRMYEFEFGLPNRFQLDLYAVSNEVGGNDGDLAFDQHKVELRWALADWGKIWGNPTAYLEWVARDQEADKLEAKLLFGDELAPGWHWGTNFVLEQETGGVRETEREVTLGISKTLLDSKLAAGAEAKFSWINDNTDRGAYTREFFLGPTLQWRPSPRVHIDVAPLFGLNQDTASIKAYIVFGWEF